MPDIRIDHVAFTPDGVLVEYTPLTGREGVRTSTQAMVSLEVFGEQILTLHGLLTDWLATILDETNPAEAPDPAGLVSQLLASRGIEHVEPWHA